MDNAIPESRLWTLDKTRTIPSHRLASRTKTKSMDLHARRQAIVAEASRLRGNLTAIKQRNKALIKLIKRIGALTSAAESLHEHNRDCPVRRLIAKALIRRQGDVDVSQLNGACHGCCRRCRTLTDRIVRLHATSTPTAARADDRPCPVCLERVTNRDQRWQCAVCKISLHVGCFEGCVRAQLGKQAVDCAACPHCRSTGSAARYPPPLVEQPPPAPECPSRE